MSRKLEASLKKIDKVFYRMDKHDLSVKKGSRMSYSTIETYTSMMKSIVREVNKEYGVSDITKIKKEHIQAILDKKIENYKKGETSEAFNVKSAIAAINAFQVGSKETGVFKREIEFCDVKEYRKVMKENKVIRHTSASKTLKPTPEDTKNVLESIRKSGYKTEKREMALKVSQVSMITGGRISSILKLQKEDFVKTEEGYRVTFVKDKGGLTRTVNIDKKYDLFIDDLISRSSNERLFFEVKKDGKIKSIESQRKEVEKIISDVKYSRFEEIIVRDERGNQVSKMQEKNFKFHSFRKHYANEKIREYYDRLGKENFQDLIKNQPKETQEKILEKYKRQMERANNGRTNTRDLTREEKAIFLTSVDLGHFRNDVVVQYYVDMKRFKEYRNTTS